MSANSRKLRVICGTVSICCCETVAPTSEVRTSFSRRPGHDHFLYGCFGLGCCGAGDEVQRGGRRHTQRNHRFGTRARFDLVCAGRQAGDGVRAIVTGFHAPRARRWQRCACDFTGVQGALSRAAWRPRFAPARRAEWLVLRRPPRQLANVENVTWKSSRSRCSCDNALRPETQRDRAHVANCRHASLRWILHRVRGESRELRSSTAGIHASVDAASSDAALMNIE